MGGGIYLFLREALGKLGGIRLILLRGKYLNRSLSTYVPVIVKEDGIIVHESTIIS